MIDFLELLICLMGVATVVLSVVAACVFARHARDGALPAAISWQLLGEAVIGLGTLAFSVAAWSGALAHWPPAFQSYIRFAMFLATSATTLHLCLTVRRISNGK